MIALVTNYCTCYKWLHLLQIIALDFCYCTFDEILHWTKCGKPPSCYHIKQIVPLRQINISMATSWDKLLILKLKGYIYIFYFYYIVCCVLLLLRSDSAPSAFWATGSGAESAHLLEIITIEINPTLLHCSALYAFASAWRSSYALMCVLGFDTPTHTQPTREWLNNCSGSSS